MRNKKNNKINGLYPVGLKSPFHLGSFFIPAKSAFEEFLMRSINFASLSLINDVKCISANDCDVCSGCGYFLYKYFNDAAASSMRPLFTSQTGDSGIKNVIRIIGRIQYPIPVHDSILQCKKAPSAYPISIPKDANVGPLEIKAPRKSGRATSVMYTTAGLVPATKRIFVFK